MSKLRRQVSRTTLIGVGSLCLVLGVIGIFVPLWPTTCFLLGAAWCYGKSSERLYKWMHENRLFGSYLSQYRFERSIPRQVQVASLLLLWCTIAITVVAIDPLRWVQLLIVLIAIAVTWHLMSLRTATVADEA